MTLTGGVFYKHRMTVKKGGVISGLHMYLKFIVISRPPPHHCHPHEIFLPLIARTSADKLLHNPPRIDWGMMSL